ncbi:MAG: dUTP diphosphatase [Bacteroidota bacterium]
MKLKICRIREEAALPRYMSAQAAGMDLSAALSNPLQIDPGGRALVPTGLAIALPIGYEGQVRPRSGLAVQRGVTVLNSPGTIDADYRGEVKVALINLGSEMVTIEHGMRIAQLVVAPVSRMIVEEIDELDGTDRGSGGFGHTG